MEHYKITDDDVCVCNYTKMECPVGEISGTCDTCDINPNMIEAVQKEDLSESNEEDTIEK